MKSRLQKLMHSRYLFWMGLAIVCLSLLPYLILGTGSYVEYYEQLDWGLLTYIYQAKYFFSGSSVIPEFLNGASKNALVEPAFGYVFVFKVLQPFAAYLVMQASEQAIAYVGMYLLLDRVIKQKPVSVIVSLMFAFLPFLAVFGLTIVGVPLVAWAVWNLYERKREGLSFFCILIFTFFSSLILSGFAVILLWTSLLLFTWFRKQRQSIWMYVSYVAMIGIYFLTNLSLVLQFLGLGESYVSHRADRAIEVYGFLDYFQEAFLYNDQHTGDFHRFFLPVILLAVCISLIRTFRMRREKSAGIERKDVGAGNETGECRTGECRTEGGIGETGTLKTCAAGQEGFLILAILGLLLFLYLIASLWNIAPVVSIRERMGGLGSFNVARVIWLAPAAWYFLLGVSLDYLYTLFKKAKKLLTPVLYVGLCVGFLLILKENQLKENVQLLLNPDYDVITYEQYYAIDVMDQLEAYIREELGLEMDEYRVISLGIDPAAALYHGFYCMDGYSDNYDVEYKYLFRTFMAAELARNDYIRSYYDDWGNRVYLFTSELTTYFNVEKGSFWFNDLQIDTAAIKEAGCDFIISAAYVVNAEELNMELLATFETDESYYRLYLYRIN